MNNQTEQVPTATHLLKKEIDRFLASDSEEVLCIRGKWGVGKTYGWNSYLRAAQSTGAIALRKYAYVSLFGVQSLDELKYIIFENTVDAKDIGTEPSIENLITHTAAVIQRVGRHSLSNIVNYLPFIKNASDTLKVVSFLTVTRQIVCIDDIERKGKGLRTQDILGLVSFLRDNRRCKVVLILNDEELDTADKEELAKFQEKVIDASLVFAPNEHDCAEIALPDRTGALKKLAERSISLGISNIRIIKKIERLIRNAEPLLNGYDPAVLEQAVQTLTLFGWAHYGRTEDKGSRFIDFVIKKRGQGWYGRADEEKLTDEEKGWDKTLDAYGFRAADDFDLALLDSIRNGFFDQERVQRLANDLNRMHIASQSDQSLNAAWQMFHDSFDNNQQDVLEAIASSFETNVQFVSPGNLSATMRLFRELGYEDEAKQALDIYMGEHTDDDRAFFDLSNQPLAIVPDDADLLKAFAEKLASFEVVRDSGEILIRIAKTQGWSNNDIATLSAMSVAEYKALFKKLRGLELRAAVRAAVGFANISNRGNEYDAIIVNSKQALIEIGDESSINRTRVRRMVGDLIQLAPAHGQQAE